MEVQRLCHWLALRYRLLQVFEEQNSLHEKLQGYIDIFWAKGLVDKAASDLVKDKEDTIRQLSGLANQIQHMRKEECHESTRGRWQ